MKSETIYDAFGVAHVLPGLYSDFPRYFRLQAYYPDGGIGEILDIDEPVGWDKLKFILERNPDWYGVSTEYSKTGCEFDGASGRDFIESIFRDQGTDANVTLQTGIRVDDLHIIEYEGRLNFSTRKVRRRKVSVSLERKSLESKLLARWDAAFKFSGSQKIPLLPQALGEKFECNVKAGKRSEITFPGDANGHIWLQFDTSQPTVSEIQEFASGKPMGLSETEGPVANDEWLFKFRSSGTFKVSIALAYRIWWTVKKKAVSIGAARITRFNVTTVLVHVHANGQPTDKYSFTDLLTNSKNGTTEVLLNPKGNLEKSIDVLAGDKLYLYGLVEFGHNKNELAQTQVEFTILTQRITIAGQTKNSPTSATAATLYDALEAGIVASTDVYDRLRSPFYGLKGARYPVSGPGSERLLFNGFAARNFKADEHPLEISSQDLLSSLRAIDGIGMSFGTEINDFGLPIDTVIIQPVAEYFRPVELLRLGEVEDYKEEVIAADLISTVDVGYAKCVDEGANALEEVHTTHQLTTPIRNEAGKRSYVSKLIASTLAIERTRREQFADKPKDGTTFDDELFIVQCVPTKNYTGPLKLYKDSFLGVGIIEVPEVIPWLTPGTTVFVAGSVNNDYPYEVTFVSDAARVPWTFYIKPGAVFVDEQVVNGQIKPSQLSPLTPETGADLYDVKGLTADSTAFNLRLTPGRLLYNTAPLWAGCLLEKDGAEEIYKSKIPQNKELVTVIEGANPLRVTERRAVPVDEIWPRLLFRPFKLQYRVRLSRAQVQRLRLGLSGMLPTEVNDDGETIDPNHGYVSLLDTGGIRVAGFVDKLEWSDTDQMAAFELRQTALDLNDTTSGLSCAQFVGWTLEQAENADDRTRRRIELCRYIDVDIL